MYEKNPNQHLADMYEVIGDMIGDYREEDDEPFYYEDHIDDNDFWDGEPWYRQIQDSRDFYSRNNRD